MKNELTIPKVLALSSVGTTIEWYDFLLAATAAVLVLSLIWLYPYFALVNTNAFASILVAVSVLGIVLGFGYGTFYAWLAESFPTRVRYSGVGVSYQLSSLIIGLITTFLIPVLLATLGAGAIWSVAWISVALGIVSLGAALLIKDRHDRDLE
ncbi:MAG: hypothetical protein KGH60_01610 [Candidatus Micrarchaeota archaeon]|nr:hypothetical protein [Candidatus Micrarchaeota archaeon]